jgi:carboxypeptidase Taq
MFKPFLEKLLKLNQEKAQALGFEGEAYDTLMHDYEPGAKVADLEATFKALRVELVELLGRLKDAPRKPDISILRRHYDLKKQELFGEMVVAALGYDFNSGRLDETTHPFTISLGPQDTRILTRYKENDFAEAFTSSVHEAGHALYDMGLLSEHYGMPMGDVKSLGTHESQSRLWENQIGRSRAFWGYFFPVAQRLFRETLSDVTLDQMYGVMNYVEPGYIRVEADEATYNLHIMLRFEMERAMLNGDIRVDEVPGEWNKRFKEYLGLEVDCDANGCLRDIHWAHGTLGYFPTYSLGNMYSAQYYAKARKDLPNLDADFAAGDFSRLLGWLRENIHQHGRRYLPADLCKKVTGEPLSAKPLLDYLKAKYAEIYGI